MHTQIIIFGGQSEEADAVFRAISGFCNWEVAAYADVELAIEKMHRDNINMIVFTKDITSTDENKLRRVGTILNEEMVFLNHGQQVSIEKEIVALLNRQRLQRKPLYNITLAALKNAYANISLN